MKVFIKRIVIIAVLLAGLPLYSEIPSKIDKIIITNSNTFPPFSFVDDDGEQKGMLVELWALWSQKSGIPVDFVQTSWIRSINMIKEGKADFHCGLFMTEERSEYLNFSDSFFSARSCLFVRTDKTAVSLDSLQIGASRQTSASIFFRKRYAAIDLRYYDDNKKLIAAAVAGEINAFATDESIARYYLSKLDELGSFRMSQVLHEDRIRAGVKKGNYRLLEKINTGLGEISDEEIKTITDKWMIANPYSLLRDWRFYAVSGGILSGLLILFIIIVMINKSLKKKIDERTGELLHELQVRKETEQILVHAQKMELIGVMASGLAHDFRNILAGISGPLSLMQIKIDEEKAVDKDEFGRYIKIMGSSADRALDISEKLTNISRKRKRNISPLDLNESVKAVVDICNVLCKGEVEVNVLYSQGEIVIESDRTSLEQILLNLCINAIHAMTIMRPPGSPGGGTLTIKLDQPGEAGDQSGFREIIIEDTGVGMSEEVIARISEPFFTTKSPDCGAGLGMTMVYGLIEELRGSISVKSVVGRGTSFSILLPVAF